MATRLVPKSQLRARIRDEMSRLIFDNIVVTDRGQPIAVIVHIDRWNHLQEQLEDLDVTVELSDLGRNAEAAAAAPTLRLRSVGPLRY